MQTSDTKCWLCQSNNLKIIKPSNIAGKVSSQAFAITDSTYGVTGELAKCQACGFILCTSLNDVLNFYENLEDPGYEQNRSERGLQAKKILAVVKKYKGSGSLLDIGAGSGILVEQALKMGFAAKGVEPSKWLQQKALEQKLPVSLGIFPHADLPGPFDVITLIDVIEHVSDPVGLLGDMAKALKPNGIIAVITPDVGALVPKILGFRWWHFRVAHIGYFNKKTLKLAASKAGLKPLYQGRAKWYFAGDYLLKRINTYLPKFLRLPAPKFLAKWTVPLNLGDSMFMVFKKISE